MRCEFPIIHKCCFCLPLRIGLLIWAYLKLILSLVILVLGCMMAIFVITSYRSPRHIVFTVIMIIFYTVNTVFIISYIIGAHQKRYKIMRTFYYFNMASISMPAIFFIALGVITYMDIGLMVVLFVSSPIVMISMAAIPIEFVLNIYFIMLVRSEFMKLEQNTEFQFVNLATEARCIATLPDEITMKP